MQEGLGGALTPDSVQTIGLGHFEDEVEAAKAYDAAVKRQGFKRPINFATPEDAAAAVAGSAAAAASWVSVLLVLSSCMQT